MTFGKFTYPFCYTPHPLVRKAADNLIARIDSDPALKDLFSEGKMLGVMLVRDVDGNLHTLNAFSGNVGGRSMIEGFVPPVLDLCDPESHFKKEEFEISSINAKIKELEAAGEPADALKAERKQRSVALQGWIFDNAKVAAADGDIKSIREVFAIRGIVPPGGTGDCAAPKLLNYANRNGLQPLAMGEFWYGASPRREIRHHGRFYPSCQGKCGPLLPWMMKGLDVEDSPLESAEAILDIRYEDDAIIIVNKPSGVLAVPGRTAMKSLLELLEEHCGFPVHSCHRLDMDTSGLMVYAKTLAAKVNIEGQFAAREVHKTYVARLCPGVSIAEKGRIELPLAPDWYDRPRQMVDSDEGKTALTLFEKLGGTAEGYTDVRFTPLTGRTHQLRVHAAHPEGLGRPILGDRLYGGQIEAAGKEGTAERLHLHAASLAFHHPVSHDIMEFVSEPDWMQEPTR